MNILFIVPSDPRDCSFGGAQRTNLLWRALQNLGTVYVVVPIGWHEPMRVEEGVRIRWVSFFSPNILVRLGQRVLARLGRGLVWPFRSRALIRSRIGWEDVRFDFVVTRYIGSAAMTSAWKLGPCYVDVDDWPPEMYRTNSRDVGHPLRFTFFHQMILIWSRYVLRQCAGAWIANPEQVVLVKTAGETRELCNLPIPPTATYVKNVERVPVLFTVGLMLHGPNYMGVDKFLNEIWPVVHARFPELEYWIAGKGPPEEYAERWRKIPQVKLLGFVENIDACYEKALATVVPVWSGAGTCIKTRESLLRGRICLSTPFGARGCAVSWVDGSNGLHVFESADEFVTLLEKFVLDERLRIRQEVAAFRLGEKEFSFTAFSSSVKELLNLI